MHLAHGEGHKEKDPLSKMLLAVAGAISCTSYCNHDDDNDSKTCSRMTKHLATCSGNVKTKFKLNLRLFINMMYGV